MKRNSIIILISFIALKFLLQYLYLSPAYDLQRDEYLHLDQAGHLAWGFESVPPFTSWTSFLIRLLGNTMFWIRFFPALYGALTICVVCKTIETLNGNLFAQILGATGILFSILLRLNSLYQPNSFDVLSWTFFYFTVIKYVKTGQTKWLFVATVAFAIGFLNKYNIIFLLIGLLPALLLSSQRKLFGRPAFYAALALGLIIIAPNLWWQYCHHFPVVHHLKELSETQLVHVDAFIFFKSQLIFFIGSLPVIVMALCALLLYEPLKPYRFFAWGLFFTLGVFSYFKAKDYYAIGLYPVYIAFGAAYCGELLKTGWKRYLQPVVLMMVVLLYIPVLNVSMPNKRPEEMVRHNEVYQKWGMLRWEDGREHELPQDFADMLGWKELAAKVDHAYAGIAGHGTTLVLCDNYGQAGAINYYSKYKIKAVAFEADYLDWFDLTKHYENLIRVKGQKDAGKELGETAPFFQTAQVSGVVTNRYAREAGTTVFIFTGAKIDIRPRLADEIGKEKN